MLERRALLKSKMRHQMLDQMDIEQERGTIKLQPVTMKYKDFTLNLIDTLVVDLPMRFHEAWPRAKALFFS